MTAGTGLTAFH